MSRLRARHLVMAMIATAFLVVATNPMRGTSAVFSTRTTNGGTIANGVVNTPTSLQVSINTSGGTGITLLWTATPTRWATGERVYRRLGLGGAFLKVAEFANLTTTTYSEDPGTSDVYYVVRGYYTNANGGHWESRDSNLVKPPVHAAALDLVNKGLLAGKPELGDQIVLTFSERMDPSSFGTCSTGGNSGMDLTLNATSPNTVVANGGNLTIGTIDLGATGYFTIGGTALNSTCSWSTAETVLTITLGAVLNGGLVLAAHTATYRPDIPTPATLTVRSFLQQDLDTTAQPTVIKVLF